MICASRVHENHQTLPRNKGPRSARTPCFEISEWQLADLNRGHPHFQCGALPTELSCPEIKLSSDPQAAGGAG